LTKVWVGFSTGDTWHRVKHWLLWHTGDAGECCWSLLLFSRKSSDPRFGYGIDLAESIPFFIVQS